MAKQTVWNLEPHTLGKHEVLRRYLDAWLPIMAKWNGRILFIDGFAGPGEYRGGEPGSPVIAVRALLDHQVRSKIRAEVGFIFIESDLSRIQHLTSLIDPLRKKLPSSVWISLQHGKFDQKLTDVLDTVDNQATNLAPSFVMVDPFGVSATPMSVLERVLRNPKSELYISFQYEAINRFKATPEFEAHLDDLFGTTQWRNGVAIQDSNKRKGFLYSLYEQQLRDAGAEHVVFFELYEGQRLVYAIFFATQHELGSDRMKEAIWKVDPWGNFAFRPAAPGQLSLALNSADFSPLMTAIEEEFRNRDWVSIGTVTRFVQSDKTIYHSGQLKRGALVQMESEGRIEVDEATRKRKKTYPEGTMLRFVE